MQLPQNVSRQIQDVFSYQDILWEMQCFWVEAEGLSLKDENITLDEVEEEETDESN